MLLAANPCSPRSCFQEQVVNLNMKGVFRLTALVGTRMAEGDGGSIIMVSSTGSIRPTQWIIPYAAAKAGVNSMTEGFARTFGPKVRVNCIMPGPFMTDVAKEWDIPAFEAEAQRRYALGRGGIPNEIVGAALYFATDASSLTTGAVLRVDGGIPQSCEARNRVAPAHPKPRVTDHCRDVVSVEVLGYSLPRVDRLRPRCQLTARRCHVVEKERWVREIANLDLSPY
jgi:hypothetical protein